MAYWIYLIHIQLGYLGLREIDAADIEEQPVRRLHWTELFCQREFLTDFPNYCCPERWFGMNRISHPDWVKLWVELNYAPNQNTKIPSATVSCYFYRKEKNNELVDTDGFQSSSLMTAWEEVFLMPWVEENDKTLVNGYAGV